MSTEWLDKVKLAHSQIKEALQSLNGGPFDYYLTRMALHSEALLTKYAPFPVGARVVIVSPVECKGGWKGREDTLAVGRAGVIEYVDYDEKGFAFGFVPDVETYWDGAGYLPSQSAPHSYGLREGHLDYISY